MVKGIFKRNAIQNQRMVSLEERNDGVTEDEYELVFYAKLEDIARLNQLDYEDQEQWAYKFVSYNKQNVQNRVRRTIKGNSTEYTHTVKTMTFNNEQTPTYNECSISASSDLFELYKSISEKGMNKRRFILPFLVNQKEYKFEIDVFRKDADTFHDWVKVDLELDPANEDVTDWVKHLPEYLTDVIDFRNPTEEQKQRVNELYDTVFFSRKEDDI